MVALLMVGVVVSNLKFKDFLNDTINYSSDKDSSDVEPLKNKKHKKNKYKKLFDPVKWREYLQYTSAASN